jgi:hypothetical protein
LVLITKSQTPDTKVAGEKLTEAGAAVKETVVVDTLARKRLAELEEENRRLREQLERLGSTRNPKP